MRTYKGIVCEKNKYDMIFMTRNGEFLRGIPLHANAEIGDEVEFRLTATPNRRKTLKFLAPAIVAALIMLLLTSSLFYQSNNVYATIQLEGEKSIEFKVDKNGKVISARSLKDEKLELNHYQGKSIDVVITDVIEEFPPKNEDYEIKTNYKNQVDTNLNDRIEKAVKQHKEKQHSKPSEVEDIKNQETPIKEKESKNENNPNSKQSIQKPNNENKKAITPEHTNPQNNKMKEKQTPPGQEKVEQQQLKKEQKSNENAKQSQSNNKNKSEKQNNNGKKGDQN